MQQHKTKSIDIHFGEFMARLAGEDWPRIAPVSVMVSTATRAGHACLDFRSSPEEWEIFRDGEGFKDSWSKEWPPELSGCPVVGDGEGITPLVLEDRRLYLRRYWQYEKDLADYAILKSNETDRSFDYDSLEQSLARLFPVPQRGSDWQRLAALAVLLRTFVVITGGPGTGKTTTIVKIIALLQEQQVGSHGLRIALAAPTGKGVARLQAVMSEIGKNLDCSEDIRTKIPARAMTLHRLLGAIKGSPFYKFDADNPLPYDLVVVDEASMVDLPLMAKLTRALNPDARLVLLGDHNQLASVEPGAVLGDFCDQRMIRSFSREFRGKVSSFIRSDVFPSHEEQGRWPDSLVELQDSYRFEEESGIGRLSHALIEGDSLAALDVLQGSRYPDAVWREVGNVGDLRSLLEERWRSDVPEWTLGDDPLAALNGMGQRQMLCAVRLGPYGVEIVNDHVRAILGKSSGLFSGATVNFHGQPIMVTTNDHSRKLYNGDTGVIMADPESGGRLFAFFHDWEKGLRKISLAMLPPHETVYAMTVHKSQGSEFDEVVIVLPDDASQVLTRELIYTAVTRAKKKVEVWGAPKIFIGAVEVTINRHSGLKDKIARGC